MYLLFSSMSSFVIQSLSLLKREVFHIIYASLKKVLCFVLRKVFGRLVEILWFILFYSSSLSLRNLLYPHLSIPYEHLYNINVLLGNPLTFSPPFFIQLLVMVFFILHCLSNQNTQHSEHVDLTVSIHKHFKSLNVILKLD